jgi:hypothetical protein
LYPPGHARWNDPRLADLLETKFLQLAGRAVADPARLRSRLLQMEAMQPDEIASLYAFPLTLPKAATPEAATAG